MGDESADASVCASGQPSRGGVPADGVSFRRADAGGAEDQLVKAGVSGSLSQRLLAATETIAWPDPVITAEARRPRGACARDKAADAHLDRQGTLGVKRASPYRHQLTRRGQKRPRLAAPARRHIGTIRSEGSPAGRR